jgi:glucose-1-phosphate thymidylyltransferase
MTDKYKGIVLAGGNGSRLYPITLAISKQLLPVYNKPMIYYPISVLMLAGIRKILIISTHKDLLFYKNLLGDGSQFGVQFSFLHQHKPRGLAEAFIIGEKFINKNKVSLILGDNIFYGQNFSLKLENCVKNNIGATIFGYHVSDPERFGVIKFNKKGIPLSIEEKPKKPKSNYAITGLYFYDNNVVEIAKSIQPSKRGELEISDINKVYLKNKKIRVEFLGRGFAWLDTGTYKSLLAASQFVETIESRQNLMVACLEEIAFKKGWITKKILLNQSKKFNNTEYGTYLSQIYKNS